VMIACACEQKRAELRQLHCVAWCVVSVGVASATSSVEGTTSWKNNGNRIVLQADRDSGYSIDLHVTIEGKLLEGRCSIANPDVRLSPACTCIAVPLSRVAGGDRDRLASSRAGIPGAIISARGPHP
jgi:hypothetical protein